MAHPPNAEEHQADEYEEAVEGPESDDDERHVHKLRHDDSDIPEGCKPFLMLLVLAIICGVGAYFILKRSDKNEKKTTGIDEVNEGNMTSYTPQLICVTRTSPIVARDVVTHPLAACDYLIYYPRFERSDTKISLGIRGIKIYLGISLDYPDSSGSASTDRFYETLGQWVGTKYAILDFVVANDFSDFGEAPRKIENVFRKLKKSYTQPELVALGIKVNPSDADATKKNGAKLGVFARDVIIIFQSHEPPKMQPCKIGINELMISKEDYLKISDGMDNPVAISTTLAIGRFRPLNSNETGTGAACSTRELLNRTNENCAAMGTLTNSGHEQNGEFVYEYITNETAQNLFVTFVDKPASASWKYNIAFFDVDFYGRQDNISCPIFPLSDFYRKGPRT